MPARIDLRNLVKVEKKTRNVLYIRMDVRGDDWERWFLLSSDRHHDSIDCDRDLELEHLQLARQRKAKVLDFGDIFDCMQGKYDPRRDYPDMRPEYMKMMARDRIGYLDAIVQDAIDFYGPYADLFALIGRGNHETAIQKHNDTDLIDRLVYGLNVRSNTQVYSGAYGGWVCFLFTLGSTQRDRVNLKYIHGYGGGGPVTKGTIQSNRQAVYLPDADIVVNGHIHESWILNIPRERISKEGVIFQDLQYHVRTPTYKNDYRDGGDGWHIERGMPPKPKGAVWLRFYRERPHIRIQLMQDVR